MNSHFSLPSELSVKKLTISSQSSESRKIRGEADAISTQRPLLSLNSHIFFFVVDQRKRRQRQASKTADVCSAFEPQLPAEIIDVYKLTNFIQSSLAAKAIISCPNELRTRKLIYVRFQLLSYQFYSKYSRRNTSCRSRQHQAIQLWPHFQYFKLPFILSAEPLIG